MIGADGKCDLAMRIWADLQQQIDDGQEQIDSQQQQIDQLTGAVCGLSVLTGNPTHPEFCEVVVPATCGCDEVLGGECACDPGRYFQLESCEPGSFPHPDSGEVPPPQCQTVKGCRGTFTRIASGDAGSVEVVSDCVPERSGERCSECKCDCHPCGSSWCCNDCDEL